MSFDPLVFKGQLLVKYVTYLIYTTLVSNFRDNGFITFSLNNANRYEHITMRLSSVIVYSARAQGVIKSNPG
jgi:hypothetical protein